YRSFEDWVTVPKVSSISASSLLQEIIVNSSGGLSEDLREYTSRLCGLRKEIDIEISEAGDWFRYFKKRRGENGG
ncbi:MAG: hypothetical protein FGF48_10965, partial [Candidatus Brockarchaeota archaeon]|nr:hypothetical protein [Candidatus Brockarchaeota archaeon]